MIGNGALRSALLVLVFCGGALTAGARDWHVAPGGVDGGPGTVAEPLATLAHAVGRASSGDTILLQRRGTYRALDLDVGSGLTIESYGNGKRPIVTGSIGVTMTGSWGQNPEVLTAPISQRVVACYVDGRFVRLARWPNVGAGFLRNDADNQPDEIVDAELASRPGVAPGRWTGAFVRWRRWSWWWETRPVTQHGLVDTLALGPEGKFHDPFSDPGSGYFIDHDLDELDAPGEWHWESGVLYLYPPEWADPATMKVHVVTTASTDVLVDHGDEPTGVRTSGTSFHNIHFSRYYGTALAINRPAIVTDCTFSELESNAVRYTWDSQPFEIRRSVFRDIRNIAISGWADLADPAGSLIERNLFLRIGVEPGYGGWGSWHAAGVILGQTNAGVVRLNRFVDTGYAGIILGSDGQTVEKNVFVRAMHTLNDGGAVYTNCNASIIRDNIILDTIGDLEYSHEWWPLGHGIWPEFLSDFHDTVITGNTIYGSNGHGIFLPNNFDCTIADNVIVDNRRAALGLYVGNDPDQGHTITGNTLVSTEPSRRIQRPENLSHWWLPPYSEPDPVCLEYDDTGDFGIMSHTTFVALASCKNPGSRLVAPVSRPASIAWKAVRTPIRRWALQIARLSRPSKMGFLQEARRAPFAPSSASGSQGSWKKKMYHDFLSCLRVRSPFLKSSGCGRLRTMKRSRGRTSESAENQPMTPPQSCARSRVRSAPEASMRPATSSTRLRIR
jgi:parallel beta-helix repeat protein